MSAASPGTTFSKLLYERNYLTSNEGFELGEVHPAEDCHDAVARHPDDVPVLPGLYDRVPDLSVFQVLVVEARYPEPRPVERKLRDVRNIDLIEKHDSAIIEVILVELLQRLRIDPRLDHLSQTHE